MIRNLKVLGLALVAVFAMSAVAASAASATTEHLECEGVSTCEVTIEQHPGEGLGAQTFETDLGSLECSEFMATYRGAAAITETATLENVEYNGCEFAGIFTEVNFNGCDYELIAPAETVVAGEAKGGLNIGGAPCEIEINTGPGLCTVTIAGGQQFANAITYTDANTGRNELTAHMNIAGLEYESQPNCILGEVSNEDGVLHGTLTAKAFDTLGNQINLNTVTT